MSSVNTSSPAARVETVGFFRSERMGFVVPPVMSFVLGKERSRRAHPRSARVCPCPSPSSSKAKSSSFNAAGRRQPTPVVVYRRQNGNPNPWLWKPRPTRTHCKMETQTLSDEGSGAGMVIPGGFMGKDSEGSLAARDLAVDLAVWLQWFKKAGVGLFGINSAKLRCLCDNLRGNFVDMDASAGQSLYPLQCCKTLHLVRHAQGIHNVDGEKDHSAYLCQEFFDAQLTPLGWQQVDNLHKHVHACGLSKKIDLVIASPLLRTMQTAVGVFGGKGYANGIDVPPLMVANVGNSEHSAISSLNCPPFIAVELCRERLAHLLYAMAKKIMFPGKSHVGICSDEFVKFWVRVIKSYKDFVDFPPQVVPTATIHRRDYFLRLPSQRETITVPKVPTPAPISLSCDTLAELKTTGIDMEQLVLQTVKATTLPAAPIALSEGDIMEERELPITLRADGLDGDEEIEFLVQTGESTTPTSVLAPVPMVSKDGIDEVGFENSQTPLETAEVTEGEAQVEVEDTKVYEVKAMAEVEMAKVKKAKTEAARAREEEAKAEAAKASDEKAKAEVAQAAEEKAKVEAAQAKEQAKAEAKMAKAKKAKIEAAKAREVKAKAEAAKASDEKAKAEEQPKAETTKPTEEKAKTEELLRTVKATAEAEEELAKAAETAKYKAEVEKAAAKEEAAKAAEVAKAKIEAEKAAAEAKVALKAKATMEAGILEIEAKAEAEEVALVISTTMGKGKAAASLMMSVRIRVDWLRSEVDKVASFVHFLEVHNAAEGILCSLKEVEDLVATIRAKHDLISVELATTKQGLPSDFDLEAVFSLNLI
ncbi:hypothetical protein L1049_026106 [Liquidambar formosana]|uniref:Uncharacterized protein n=1 Tax=Liquidambar formosana TaxID=63359 RepID=A0AAP0R649_LIQFO